MAYSRLPNTVQAGRGLSQTPAPTSTNPPGIVEVMLDTDIATTATLGVIQVGSGLSITADGILSATGSSDFVNVKLTITNYTATTADYYIGANKKDITITLPLGIIGKVYVIKNQVSGEVTVTGTLAQKIDTTATKTLGTNDSIMVVFDGVRWNIIQ